MTTDRIVTPELAVRLCERLTLIECQTMRLVLQGYSSKEIARLIGRSAKTVEATRGRVYEKLGAINSSHAAVVAIKGGLA